MYEFDQYSAQETRPAVRPANKIEFVTGIRKRAFLVWSEHCVECAAPECYSTCDLYTPRPDLRCRRFESGMRRNKYFGRNIGSAADIVFGQWGKLEARGNASLMHSGLVSLLETLLPPLQKLVNAVGRLIQRFGSNSPWSSLSFELLDYFAKRMQKAELQDEKPDGFLIEIYNPDTETRKVTFSCAVASSKMLTLTASGKLAVPYRKQLVIDHGYNCWFIPYVDLGEVVESRLPYNLSFTPDQASGVRLVFISTDFVKVDSLEKLHGSSVSSTEKTPAAKCVVFDLDNTLWDGVLLEGDVTLRSNVAEIFKRLDERGILITVASKNNVAEAMSWLKQFDLAKYLTLPVINWNTKSKNIMWLADKLSIGTDTFIFIDDSPFEREEVLENVPGIEVLPETQLDQLLDHPRLSGGKTTESANRRAMYQQQVQRSEAAMEFGNDYLAFLEASKIVVTIGTVEEKYYERVTELLQRTNQLNFSGTKYSREAIEKLLEDSDLDKHVIHCSDKYGDYGLVGFSITGARPDEEFLKKIDVQDFMLSCRVQGKLIEKAFFSYLVNRYTDGEASLNVNFVSTKRNGLARAVLEEIGFSMQPESGASLSVEPGQLNVDFLELRTGLPEKKVDQ